MYTAVHRGWVAQWEWTRWNIVYRPSHLHWCLVQTENDRRCPKAKTMGGTQLYIMRVSERTDIFMSLVLAGATRHSSQIR